MNAIAVLRRVDESRLIKGVAATAEIFRTLEVAPLIGRGFNAQEDQPDAPRVVVIGFGLWQRAFGGDPHIVGKQISLSADEYSAWRNAERLEIPGRC